MVSRGRSQIAPTTKAKRRNNAHPARVILSGAESRSGGEVELRSSAERSDGGTSGGKSTRLSLSFPSPSATPPPLPRARLKIALRRERVVEGANPYETVGASPSRNPRPIKEQRTNPKISSNLVGCPRHGRARHLPSSERKVPSVYEAEGACATLSLD